MVGRSDARQLATPARTEAEGIATRRAGSTCSRLSSWIRYAIGRAERAVVTPQRVSERLAISPAATSVDRPAGDAGVTPLGALLGGAGRRHRTAALGGRGRPAAATDADAWTRASCVRMLAPMRLDGLHHITAITGDAVRNVDFYTRVLGLRLVAKSVNQDDPGVYHLFYASEDAKPGSELTFFEYPYARPGRAGAGMVHRIVWRVADAEALDFWAERLADEASDVERSTDGLRFADFEGLGHELVVSDAPDVPLTAEHPEIAAEHALQGFEGVRAYAAEPGASERLLEDVLGAERRSPATWELRGERRGSWIAYDSPPPEPGRQSAGTVHHVAWATTAAAHEDWWRRVDGAGIPNSGIIDRHYFQSIYFREPSGVLFELADDAPGFTVDDPLEELGRRIILPPRLEAQREAIEARLTPLPDPRAGWPTSR